LTQRKDIGARLENWGKCYRTGSRGLTAATTKGWREPSRGGSPLTMTAIAIERLRAASFGPNGKSRSSTLDYDDARVIEKACAKLEWRSKALLRLYYVWHSAPATICRKLDIRHWPVSHFNNALAQAKDEIEQHIDS
jgi:hypothetical protein